MKSSGIGRLDYCIVSHMDEDHISGYMELLADDEIDALRIGSFILPDIGNPDEAYKELEKEAAAKGIAIYKVCSGNEFKLGQIQVRCVNPERGVCYEDKNTYSAVLELKYGDFSALLTGDVQNEGEEAAAGLIDGSYTLLQVAHHGSKNSSISEFLEAARPRIAVISCGRNNRYGHPHEEAIERLRQYTDKIYTTVDAGAITVVSNGKKAYLKTFL